MPAGVGTDKVYDQGLNYVLNNVDNFVLLNGEPTSFSDADTLASQGGKKLSEQAITASEITKQADGSGGRELVIPKRGHIADESGTVSHIALIDRVSSELLVYTEHDDGAGANVSVTADVAYNIEPTDIRFNGFVVA